MPRLFNRKPVKNLTQWHPVFSDDKYEREPMKNPIFSDDFDDDDDEFSPFVDREATPSHGLLDSEFEEYRDSFQDEDEDDLDEDEFGDDEDGILNPSEWLNLSQDERQNRMNSMSNADWKKQESIMQNYFEGDEDEESEDDFFEDDEDDFDL